MNETIMPPASAVVRYTVPSLRGVPLPGHCARHVDHAGAPSEILLIEKVTAIDLHGCRVGNKGIHISKRELRGLDLRMDTIGSIDAEGLHLQMFKDTERDECAKALTIGR